MQNPDALKRYLDIRIIDGNYYVKINEMYWSFMENKLNSIYYALFFSMLQEYTRYKYCIDIRRYF